MNIRFAVALAAFCGAVVIVSANAVFAQRPPTQAAEQRIALVIGNSAYKDSPLSNPGNDAADMAKALGEMGFKVILRRNANTTAMRNAIREFGQELRRAQVGLFYYAGHGVQIKGNNFLIPIGADIRSEADAEDQSIDANYVLRTMEEAQAKVNIVILDACRNNPYARSFRSAGRGLAQMTGATGTLIAFSTAPGSVAEDGTGRNGLYTQHLLHNLRQADSDILKVFQRTRAGVVKDTAGKQTPWELNSLVGDFYFRATAGGAQVATAAHSVSEITPPSSPVLTAAAGASSKELDSVDFLEEIDAYLKQAPAAVTELRRQAEAGDVLAQARWCAVTTHERYNLGIRPEEGIAHCRRLAEEGVPVAMYLYGRAFLYGRGIAKDHAEAARWFRQSAEKGNALGMVGIGALNLYGLGMTKDVIEAHRWIRQAAEIRQALAMALLGSMYMNGQGVAKDDAEALKWSRMGAEKNDALAMGNLGYMYGTGRGVAKDDAEAVKWYRMGAERSNALAMGNLGVMYMNGRGVAKDDTEAVKWYRLAAEKGNEIAMNNLGFMYASGRGVTKNDTEAVKWYRIAAEKGYVIAMRNLGHRYETGAGIAKDLDQATQWYRKAADKGDDAAAKALARLSR